MRKMITAKKISARVILGRYLANKNPEELKALFFSYQEQVASSEGESKAVKKASVSKGFATFNLLPQGAPSRYLEGVELDDQRAMHSDWMAVGEDLSAAWLQTQVKEVV